MDELPAMLADLTAEGPAGAEHSEGDVDANVSLARAVCEGSMDRALRCVSDGRAGNHTCDVLRGGSQTASRRPVSMARSTSDSASRSDGSQARWGSWLP